MNKIKNPVLVVWGKHDKLIPFEKVEYTVNRIPHAKVELIDKASHIPSLEKSKEFNQITLDFLNSFHT